MDDVDDARRQGGFGEHLAKLDRVVRGFLAWLNDNRVAGYERRSHFPGDQEEGKVPGKNSADDADRLTEKKDGFTGPVALQNLALDSAGPFGHIVDIVGGEPNLQAGKCERFALLLSD